MTRPVARLRAIASRLVGPEAMERIIEPILADRQCEYEEAVARRRLWRARLSLIRSDYALASALFWLAVSRAWSTDRLRSEAARTCAVSAVASLVFTIALVMPPLLQWPTWQRDPGFTAILSFTLVPQALPLSIPAALCVAVLWAMRGKVVTGRRVGTVLASALVFTAVVWIVLEWMMPLANQAFREMAAARVSNGRVVALEPGLNELGLSRLGQRSDPAAIRHHQLLWALCFASAPLSLLAFGLARYVRRAVSAIVLAIGLCNAYFAIMWASAAAGPAMRPSVPVWTANVVFLLIGSGLLMRAQRQAHLRIGD